MTDNKVEEWDESRMSSSDLEIVTETEGFLQKPRQLKHQGQRKNLILYLRLAFEVFLLAVLASLFGAGMIHRPGHEHVHKKYGPSFPTSPTRMMVDKDHFGPNITYADSEMMSNFTHMRHVHQNWQQLFPKSRGYVKTLPTDDFTLRHPPFKMHDVFEKGDYYEGYIVAVYHQLHCLSILVTSLGTSREQWAALDGEVVHHRAHCIEYLRQSILCHADTTMEGEVADLDAGEGQEHQCTDFDAMTDWVDERAIWDMSDKLLPELYDPLAVKDKDQ